MVGSGALRLGMLSTRTSHLNTVWVIWSCDTFRRQGLPSLVPLSSPSQNVSVIFRRAKWELSSSKLEALLRCKTEIWPTTSLPCQSSWRSVAPWFEPSLCTARRRGWLSSMSWVHSGTIWQAEFLFAIVSATWPETSFSSRLEPVNCAGSACSSTSPSINTPIREFAWHNRAGRRKNCRRMECISTSTESLPAMFASWQIETRTWLMRTSSSNTSTKCTMKHSRCLVVSSVSPTRRPSWSPRTRRYCTTRRCLRFARTSGSVLINMLRFAMHHKFIRITSSMLSSPSLFNFRKPFSSTRRLKTQRLKWLSKLYPTFIRLAGARTRSVLAGALADSSHSSHKTRVFTKSTKTQSAKCWTSLLLSWRSARS